MQAAKTDSEVKYSASLIDVIAVAAMLSSSKRHVYRLRDADRMPRPVRLGGLVRWNREEIERWISEGCPVIRAGEGGAK